jgi:hypothetical protein
MTHSADPKALQANVRELQKNLQKFVTQIAPIIQAASGAHQSHLAHLAEAAQQKSMQFLRWALDPQRLQDAGKNAIDGAQVVGKGALVVVAVAWVLVSGALTENPLMRKGV